MTIRKILPLGVLLLLAACAHTAAPPPTHVPLPPPPPLRAEPQSLAGLSPAAVRSRFGAPVFSRKDGATEMWRYDGAGCHVFFFFTGNVVRHVETIPRRADAAADPACLNALKKTS